jgi:ferritin-like metal-binding protein YciE
MELSTLQDLLEEQIKDLYSAETQLVKAMSKISKKISSDELKGLFNQHLTETEQQVGRLEQISKSMKMKLTGKRCLAMEGLIAEAIEALSLDGEDDILDLALIAAVRRVEHYEISAYSSARDLAEAIGEEDVVSLLDETLREEEQVEQSLTVLSEDIIDLFSTPGEDEEEEQEPRTPAS